jgi:hypothetical protein
VIEDAVRRGEVLKRAAADSVFKGEAGEASGTVAHEVDVDVFLNVAVDFNADLVFAAVPGDVLGFSERERRRWLKMKTY